MAGETSCEWAPWFRTNYQNWDRPPSDFDLTTWQIAHTRLLREIRQKSSAQRVLVENQAQFYYERDSGLVLSGKPDLVLLDGTDGVVVDAKTGQPKASDRIQVMIYMRCLPEAHRLMGDTELAGRVVYQDGHVIEIPPERIRGEFEDQFQYFLDILDSDDEPARVPSERECGFCNIGAGDCPERVVAAFVGEGP